MKSALAMGLGLFAVFGAAACRTTTAGTPAELSAAKDESSVLTHAGVLAAWDELGPDGSLIVRAVSTSEICPALTVDGGAYPMTIRTGADAAFPVLVCESTVPGASQAVAVVGRSLATPAVRPERIVVLGNTGCVLKNSGGAPVAQACDDAQAWPTAKLALAAAAEHPDLVVHLGNIHGRMAPCPQGAAGCANATVGDVFQSWREDFFVPFAPLLAVAPWIFVRGPNEACGASGEGWFHFFDPHALPPHCTTTTPPYWVPVGDQAWAIIDAAESSQAAAGLAALHLPAGGAAPWLVAYRPLGAATTITGGEQSALPAAFARSGAVYAMLAGSQPEISLSRSTSVRPPLLQLGSSGGLPTPSAAPSSARKAAGTYSGFGYLSLNRQADDSWQVVVHDEGGGSVSTCTLKRTAATAVTQLRCS